MQNMIPTAHLKYGITEATNLAHVSKKDNEPLTHIIKD
jgi:hypothetical protein